MEPMYTADFQYTFEEYRRFNQAVKNKILHAPLLVAVLMALLLIMALMGLAGENYGFFFGMLLGVPLVPLLLFVFGRAAMKKTYRSNRFLDGSACRYGFYADHLTQESRYGNQNIPYNRLYRVLETKTHFYLMLAKNQGLIVPKGNCTPELIAFLGNVKSDAEKP